MIQTSLSAPMWAVNGTVTPSWLPLPLIMAITSCNPCPSGCWVRVGRQPWVGRTKGFALGQGTARPPIHWLKSGGRGMGGGCPVSTSHLDVYHSLWPDHRDLGTSYPQARRPGGEGPQPCAPGPRQAPLKSAQARQGSHSHHSLTD